MSSIPPPPDTDPTPSARGETIECEVPARPDEMAGFLRRFANYFDRLPIEEMSCQWTGVKVRVCLRVRRDVA